MTQTAFPFDLGPESEKDPVKKPTRKKKPKAAPHATSENGSESISEPDAEAQEATAPAKKKAVGKKAKAKASAKLAAEIAPEKVETEIMPDVQGLQLDQFLCFSLYSATHAMHRVYKPLLTDIGLTYPQYLAMTVLWQKDKILVGDLGDQLHLESNTMTPLLKRLEGMELLTRTRDKKDERQVRIALTRKGRSLKQKTKTLAACILAATGLPMDEVIELQGRIMTLRNNLLKSAEETS
ncbi:MarR family winged helix-turn-helix transcriptional regulator [Roseibium algae]|uniref:MarR family transcriptional regulator n=1 Tax=Roseibium algae TaxID=3123038 RepID=A0ABU8TRB3_9HYPH